MTLRPLLIAVFSIGIALCASASQANAQLTTTPINKPLLLKQWNYVFHITRIEAYSPIGAPKFLAKMNDCGGNGYVLVVASIQNNAKSGSSWIPNLTFGLELADGTLLGGPQGDGRFLYPSFSPVPGHAYAKEHHNVVYVTCGWNGQPITKLVLAETYRMIVPKNFVKMHVASPAPSP